MRRANTTFVNLRTTLDDVAPLVEEAKPVAKRLRPYLAELRAFAAGARTVVRDLAALVRSPGKGNDLIELSHSVLPFHEAAIGPVREHGREWPGAFATSTASLRAYTPIWAFQRPYAVDLTGWFDDFSHSGVYDANGSASRVALSVNAFATVGSQLLPVPPALRPNALKAVTAMGQNNRCPGSAERDPGDGSIPFRPSPSYGCDPTQVPVGK
jgi:phospholipid/cholesterol/gamma-HCH transport system substrate-binding protein